MTNIHNFITSHTNFPSILTLPHPNLHTILILGFETVRSLSYHGCTVVLGCRDPAKGEAAAQRILKQRPSASLHPMTVDLTSLESVKNFAHAFALQFG